MMWAVGTADHEGTLARQVVWDDVAIDALRLLAIPLDKRSSVGDLALALRERFAAPGGGAGYGWGI